MDGLPYYSDAALAARDIFHVGFAETLFYVEDEDQENLYELIIQKIFPRLKGVVVLPLAGKGNVLAHARERHPQLDGVRRVYILDKDFDDLLGVQEELQGVVYLDDYCIEMAVLEEGALIQLAVDESPKRRKSDLKGAVKYERSMSEWLPSLDRLHRAFFLVQKYDLGIKNCDLPPEKFADSSARGTLKNGHIEEYIEQVSQILIDTNVISSVEEYEVLSKKCFGSARINLRHINGKFLLRLWYHRLKDIGVIGNIKGESLTIRLARASNLRRLNGLRKKVNAILAA